MASAEAERELPVGWSRWSGPQGTVCLVDRSTAREKERADWVVRLIILSVLIFGLAGLMAWAEGRGMTVSGGSQILFGFLVTRDLVTAVWILAYLGFLA